MFLDLIEKTGIHKHMDCFQYIEMLIKWLLIFNNPAGQVK